MEKLNFRSIAKILPKRQRNQLWLLSFARIMANGLDLAGLAGIALLATAFGSIASGTARQSPLVLPLIGEVIITEVEAVVIAMGIALTFVLKSFFSIWLNLRTSLKVAEIEGDFAERLTNNFFSNEPAFEGTLSETVSRFQNSILVATGQIAAFLNSRVSAVAEASLLLALVVVFMFVNPIATLATLVYLVLVILALNKVINVRLRRNSKNVIEGSETSLSTSRDLFGVRREVRTGGNISDWLSQIVSGKRRVAVGNGLNYTINSLPRYVIETSLILGIFGFLGAVVVFSDLSSQAVTIGVFMAGGLRLVASILPLQAAYNGMVASAAQAQTAFSTLVEISKQKQTEDFEDVSIEILPAAMNLKFDSVSFSFPGVEKPIVRDLVFDVEANSKTAIVGPSGAGKTTTFELATGFRLPGSGSISLSGYSPRHLLEKTSGVIGIVPQRPHLVTGTLAENVSLESAASTDNSKVIECLEKAGLEQFIGVDGQGLELEVTPDSGQLSGGEIQRLGLARALYRDPKILFLDEATSALDAETESKISKVLDSLRSQMTVVLIAHRLSTVMNADKIIYLDKGKVVAQGTFAELKKQVPDFAKAVQLMDLRE
jgi:ATP-binding cassette, subfamily B, bacterial PglK